MASTFVNRLINQGNAPILEQVVRFTGKRHLLLAENIANVDTPYYQQKDLSTRAFHDALARRVEMRKGAPVGSVRFDGVLPPVEAERSNLLFHDGNNRSVEELMTELGKNAMMHNMATELLRRQFSSIENALKERVQ